MKVKPDSGIYGDDNVYRAYEMLCSEINRFIPDQRVAGNIKGNLSEMRAKAKMIENLAKSLVIATKSCLPDRK